MLAICNNFAHKNVVTFNTTKTVCIKNELNHKNMPNWTGSYLTGKL